MNTHDTIGELQGAPLDISSLARATGDARTTTRRRVQYLEDQGVFVSTSENGRTVIRIAPDHRRNVMQGINDIIDDLVDLAASLKDYR